MQFAQPNLLLLLLIFPPAMVLFYWWAAEKRKQLMQQFINSRLLSGLVAGFSTGRQKLRFGCLVGAIACLIVALARPQWGFSWEEVKVRGVDIVVAIDTSKSMLATDVAPNRLARAKLAALDLIQLARSDRLALIAFAGRAFLQCPLTIDDVAFRQSVEALNVNTIPEGGTAIAEAINTAETAFKEGDNHRVLVLMTDGEDQDSEALEAAKKAAQSGLKIFTIGIGTADGELLRVQDAKGNADYVRDEQGNVVKSHLNERLLQELASASPGGFYLRLQGAKTIDTLYTEGLSKLPKSEHQQKLVKQYQERYHWPLAAAIVLLIIEILIPERKKEPAAPSPSALPRPVRTAIAALLCISVLSAMGSPSSALREYKAGKYEDALKEYEKLLQHKADDPRLHFNAGAAAYRNHQFQEATKQFDAAVTSPDLNLQELSYYNRGNAQYWLGEGLQDVDKRNEAWQKALKDYELSMKLNPQDVDAKFNHDYVKQKLEELKQQQQKSDKNNKDNQDKQDQNQQSNPDSKDQQQQQQQQQQSQSQQSQQQQGQQNQDSSKNAQQQAKQNQQSKQDEQQKQTAKENATKQQQKVAKGSEQQNQREGETNGQQYAQGQMTPEQARELLDAQKGDEKMLQMKPEGPPPERPKPLHDW